MALPLIISQGLREDLLGVTWEREGKEIESKGENSFTKEDMKKAKVLITKGIPQERRAKFWLTSSGAMSQLLLNKGYYQQLILLSRQIYCKYAKQIDLDLNRSNHRDDNKYISSIRNILLCYSIRNNSIGYCQGFNFISELLYDVIGCEEETFWLFAVLIEEILPLNYYSELSGVITDTSMLMNFLPKYFPSLQQIIEDNELITTFLHKWLLSLFSHSFAKDTTYLIWDYLFLEGSLILIKAVLGIFSALKKKLLESKEDPEKLFMILSQDTLLLSSNTPSLLYALSVKKFEFNDKYINKTRGLLSFPIMTKIDEDNNDKRSLIKNNKTNSYLEISTFDIPINKALNCNAKWPCCTYNNENRVVDYLVLHTKEYAYYSNYFFAFQNHSNEEKGMQNTNLSSRDILIERKPHFCLDLVIDESIDDVQTNEDSTMDDNPVYKKLSNLVDFVNAQDTIKHQFNPNPYHLEGDL